VNSKSGRSIISRKDSELKSISSTPYLGSEIEQKRKEEYESKKHWVNKNGF